MPEQSNTTSEVVLVTGSDLKPEAVQLLHSHAITLVYTGTNPSNACICELASRHQISGLIVRQGDIDRDVITASTRLKVIANHGAGYDNIDAEAIARAGIPFFIARARNATSVAEHALMLMLSLYKNLRSYDSEVRDGHWCGAVSAPRELSEKTVGLIGFGATGRALARLLQPFQCNIIVYDPVSTSIEASASISQVTNIEHLLQASDIVSLHVPLTPDTKNLISKETLKLFKHGAMLINTSRGDVIDEPAVANALTSGLLSCAGLDTFSEEPMSKDHIFSSIPNILLSPHVAGVTSECLTRMSLATAENVLCILRGTPENQGDRI